MTTATEPCTTSTSDALQRVHHHSYVRDRPRRLAGEPVQALCGIVKRANPKASELPCCPMCADLLARDGDRCVTER